MSDDALISAILENPDDDVPRLVYADWLEECGGDTRLARAQFIRLEIEAESMPEGLERAEVERAAAKLYIRNCERWNQELPGYSDWYDTFLTYRRGFVESVRTTFRRFVYADQKLLRAIPMRKLGLYMRRPGLPILQGMLANLSELPDLTGLRSLKLGPGLEMRSPYQFRELAEAIFFYPTLTNITELDLSGNHITNDSATYPSEILQRAVFYPRLQVLSLAENALSDAAAAYMTASNQFDHLRELHLEQNHFTEHGRRLLISRFGDRVFL